MIGGTIRKDGVHINQYRMKGDSMKFKQYQEEARKTAVYNATIVYPAFGLGSEVGEIQGKIKKVIRDKNCKFDDKDIMTIALELGDILWYISNLASDMGLDLEYIAQLNLEKLKSRQERGKLQGEGDNR